jgi:hypothetical protein
LGVEQGFRGLGRLLLPRVAVAALAASAAFTFARCAGLARLAYSAVGPCFAARLACAFAPLAVAPLAGAAAAAFAVASSAAIG